VTDPASSLKAPYDPDAAAGQARRDAMTFTAAVRERLSGRAAAGEQPLAVVAWDTELFGHWWHEGPLFLAAVLRMLPDAGVRLATLGQVAAEQRDTAKPVDLPMGSWGHGKDLRLWAGDAVADLVREDREVAARLLDVVRRCAPPGSARDPRLDDLAREALLALSSDWAFMVSRDTAAGYARDRHAGHVRRFHQVADGMDTVDRLRRAGHRVVPHLDARTLHRPGMTGRLTGHRKGVRRPFAEVTP